jgi:hypothetical protein
MDLRVKRLHLAGNSLETSGLAKVTEYIWNCPDPLLEVDLSSNQVDADPTKGDPGSDSVSALLRCFYNHPSYPQIVTGERGVEQVLPLTLRLGGNRVKKPAKLIKAIEAKGGRKHIEIRASPEPYDYVGKEYVSVCLPEFLTQQAVPENCEHERKQLKRSSERSSSEGREKQLRRKREVAQGYRSVKSESSSEETEMQLRRQEEAAQKAESREHERQKGPCSQRQRRAVLTPGPVAARGGEKITKSVKPEKLEKDFLWRGEKNKKSRGGAATPTGSAGSEGSPARGQPPTVEKRQPPHAGRPSAALRLSDAAQQTLQQEVREKLSSFKGVCSEDATRDMLSEFVVCMAVAGKSNQEIQGELKTFLRDEVGSFVKWFRIVYFLALGGVSSDLIHARSGMNRYKREKLVKK